MAVWLLKSEPDVYSYGDLVRDKREPWDGVANPTAQMNMRAMKRGDGAWIYHSQTDKAIVGLAKIAKGPYQDPDHPGFTAKGDPKRVLVDVAPVKKLAEPIELKRLREDGRFEMFPLIRQPRLSVMPVPEEIDAIFRDWAGLG